MLRLNILVAALLIFHQQLRVLAAPAVLGSDSDSNGDGPFHPTSSSTHSTPTSTSTSIGLSSTQFASDDPNDSFFDEFQVETPEAIRGDLGTTVIGPQNVPLDRENPDLLAPPSTDAGTVANAKWPFSLSHNRLQKGGWARQQNSAVLPVASQMAGVNMRLETGAIRELHWHSAAEWGYIIKGQVRVTAVTSEGQNYEANVNPGDVWYFPAGTPHSIQATSATTDGSEFLLVFDTGDFSEDDTFLLTDWLAHIPKEVLAKNFKVDISAFNNIPANQLYIFPGAPPPPLKDNKPEVSSPQGQPSQAFTFEWSQVSDTPLAGGSVKIVDTSNFPVSTTIAAADVHVDVGGMRELHWHPTKDEWSFFLSGTARVTVFAASGSARTFDYGPGDVGYVPATNGHYVENIGNDTLHFLEIFKSDRVEDISLNQWLALTPPELVKAHLNLDDETISKFNKTKQTVV